MWRRYKNLPDITSPTESLLANIFGIESFRVERDDNDGLQALSILRAEHSVAVEGLVVAMPVVIDTFYMDCKTMQLCFTKFEWLIRL